MDDQVPDYLRCSYDKNSDIVDQGSGSSSFNKWELQEKQRGHDERVLPVYPKRRPVLHASYPSTCPYIWQLNEPGAYYRTEFVAEDTDGSDFVCANTIWPPMQRLQIEGAPVATPVR